MDTNSVVKNLRAFIIIMLPLEKMDLCLYGKDNGIAAADLAPVVGLDEQHVDRMYAVIESKRKVARYLHAPALSVV